MDVWRRTGSATAMPAGWAFHLVLLLFLANFTVQLSHVAIECILGPLPLLGLHLPAIPVVVVIVR